MSGPGLEGCEHVLEEETAGSYTAPDLLGGVSVKRSGRCQLCGRWFDLEGDRAGSGDLLGLLEELEAPAPVVFELGLEELEGEGLADLGAVEEVLEADLGRYCEGCGGGYSWFAGLRVCSTCGGRLDRGGDLMD